MLALYRKYRPSVFDEVIGQEHITRTLVNQIRTDRITHAYLFTGSRGTGKTSCARIFARAVNCLSPKDGSPCSECEVCRAHSGGNMDILELDAASNNGVDQIRDIVENVQYPPMSGRYKVYIIDEVHMLSPSAFNALLKTLEEPPSHAIFVLATTEAHKLPATVLSRCMRFDFRLVAQEELKNYLRGIYASEKVKIEDSALDLIAASAEGSVRDMLSIADRCMNFSLNLTYADVLAVLGAGGREEVRALTDAVCACDFSSALAVVDRLMRSGKSAAVVAKDVTLYARDLLVLKTSTAAAVDGSPEEIEKMKSAAKNYTRETLVSVITVFSAIEAELRYSLSPRLVLECAVLRASKLALADLSTLEERVFRLEKKLAGGREEIRESAPPTAAAKPPAEKNAPQKAMDARSVFGRLLTYLRLHDEMACALVSLVEEVEVKRDKFILYVNADSFLRLSAPDFIAAIGKALEADGAPYTAEIAKKEEDVDMDNEIARIMKKVGKVKVNIVE